MSHRTAYSSVLFLEMGSPSLNSLQQFIWGLLCIVSSKLVVIWCITNVTIIRQYINLTNVLNDQTWQMYILCKVTIKNNHTRTTSSELCYSNIFPHRLWGFFGFVLICQSQKHLKLQKYLVWECRKIQSEKMNIQRTRSFHPVSESGTSNRYLLIKAHSVLKIVDTWRDNHLFAWPKVPLTSWWLFN